MANASKNAPRMDPHRPGAIVPAEYDFVFSYNCATSQDGWPIPSHGINCELDRRREEKDADGKTIRIVNGEHSKDGRCCIIGLRRIARAKFGGRGSTGQCSICGTHFVYGDVWEHLPSGELLHVGHQCADKYNMLADRSEWELANGRHRHAAAVEVEKALRAEERAAFLEAHPGLEQDLELDHPLLKDLAFRLRQERFLSEKQVALARKLAAEVRDPSLREKLVEAPEGRQDLVGTIVSVKEVMGFDGMTTKITVKVETDDGVWLAWGTCPAAILRTDKDLRGATVQIRATLKRGRDPHFALMSRPSGSLVKKEVAA